MSVLSSPSSSLTAPLMLSNPRKRSPQIAFSADATPPSSRPPSRTHTKRLYRRLPSSERPFYVSAASDSPRLDERIPNDAAVLVRYPAADAAEERKLADMLCPRGFTVLCFENSVRAVQEVSGLLGGMEALVYGVTVAGNTEGGDGVPLVWDREAVLARSLRILHPLGGGRVALDAVVVLDAETRARVVLPVGWGVRGGGGDAENRVENVMGRVVRAVEWLKEERERKWGLESVEVEMGGVWTV